MNTWWSAQLCEQMKNMACTWLMPFMFISAIVFNRLICPGINALANLIQFSQWCWRNVSPLLASQGPLWWIVIAFPCSCHLVTRQNGKESRTLEHLNKFWSIYCLQCPLYQIWYSQLMENKVAFCTRCWLEDVHVNILLVCVPDTNSRTPYDQLDRISYRQMQCKGLMYT